MDKYKILICYSCPINERRLRLDVEDFEVKEAFGRGQYSKLVNRIQAARAEDLLAEISRGGYEILQFSGHGDELGILLESSDRKGSRHLGVDAMVSILKRAAPGLRVLILTCCYSAEYRDALAPHVPYLVTVDGPASDSAAVLFSKYFYWIYCGGESIETAISVGVEFLEILGFANEMSVSVARRGLVGKNRGSVLEVKIHDAAPLLVDVSNIRQAVDVLKIEQQEIFLQAICTGLARHRTLFETSMERVVLSFGTYLGIFSWKNDIDPITCDQVFKVSSAVREDQLGAFIQLASRYTMVAQQKYRKATERDYPEKRDHVARALKEFHDLADYFFRGPEAEILKSIDVGSAKIAAAMVIANLSEADYSLSRGDCSTAVIKLEIALNAVHNYTIRLLDGVSEPF